LRELEAAVRMLPVESKSLHSGVALCVGAVSKFAFLSLDVSIYRGESALFTLARPHWKASSSLTKQVTWVAKFWIDGARKA
jgi:hypothetical protein